MTIPYNSIKQRRAFIKKRLFNSLAGNQIKVIHHSDPTLIGSEGSIINETHGTLIISSANKITTIPKLQGKYLIHTEQFDFIVSGTILLGTPKKRSKKRFRNW